MFQVVLHVGRREGTLLGARLQRLVHHRKTTNITLLPNTLTQGAQEDTRPVSTSL